MRSFQFITAVVIALAVTSLTSVFATDWRQFRGTDFKGTAEGKPPVAFGEVKDGKPESLKWHVKLPGRGPSSPIVVGDKVIVTCSGGLKSDRIFVLAFDAKSGDELWRRQFWATGRPYSHPTSANAAPSPASDGKHIYAFYSSNDLVCLDLDGNLVWYRGLTYDYPKAANDVGMSSSPVVIDDVVLVQVENQGDSFIAGIDKLTGETKWRKERPAGAAWGSPVTVNVDGKSAALFINGAGCTCVNPSTGDEYWQMNGGGSTVSSATPDGALVYAPIDGIACLDLTDPTTQKVVWQNNKLRASNTSPILYEGKMYMLSSRGVLVCADPKNGEQLWQHRVQGSFWGTPVIANGYLYAFSDAGMSTIVKLGDTPENVSEHDFGEPILGTPAISGNAIFVRGDSSLFKIATE